MFAMNQVVIYVGNDYRERVSKGILDTVVTVDGYSIQPAIVIEHISNLVRVELTDAHEQITVDEKHLMLTNDYIKLMFDYDIKDILSTKESFPFFKQDQSNPVTDLPTYKDLKNFLSTLSEEELNKPVFVSMNGRIDKHGDFKKLSAMKRTQLNIGLVNDQYVLVFNNHQ